MRMLIGIVVAGAMVSVALAVGVQQSSSAIDSAGGRSTGGALTNICATGQPVGVQVTRQGNTVVYGGFINTFSLQPTLDSDGDGLENEVDLDNDNDGLEDEQEITGSAYAGPGATDPNDADSDDDGASDGHEAAAGSNPNVPTMYLHITEIVRSDSSDQITVTWQAQGGKSYAVYYLDSMLDPKPGTHLGNVAAVGGSAPWYATVTNLIDVTSASVTSRFYYVELLP